MTVVVGTGATVAVAAAVAVASVAAAVVAGQEGVAEKVGLGLGI
jgi:hypothetical protein